MSQPLLFGILNITEDSFSDGGRYLDPQAALAQAQKLIDDGADVLDIGAAASNPHSTAVDPETEIARLAPVIAEARNKGWSVSVDSFAAKTQSWALTQGVAYLNDIQGFVDPEHYPGLARGGAKLIVMHSVQGRGRAEPVDIHPGTVMDRIFRFFESRLAALEAAGIARERLILDPGMGFFLGSDPKVSLNVLGGLSRLKSAFGLPVLISVSRKGFLRQLVQRPVHEVGPATLAAELYAALHGADILRTHDPAGFRDALTIWAHIAGHGN